MAGQYIDYQRVINVKQNTLSNTHLYIHPFTLIKWIQTKQIQ